MATRKNGKLKMSLEFDMGTDAFARFAKALADGGFEAEVRQMAQALLEEARRRKLPIVDELKLRKP